MGLLSESAAISSSLPPLQVPELVRLHFRPVFSVQITADHIQVGGPHGRNHMIDQGEAGETHLSSLSRPISVHQ